MYHARYLLCRFSNFVHFIFLNICHFFLDFEYFTIFYIFCHTFTFNFDVTIGARQLPSRDRLVRERGDDRHEQRDVTARTAARADQRRLPQAHRRAGEQAAE